MHRFLLAVAPAALALALSPVPASGAETSRPAAGVLVSYSFDDESVDAGPDTLAIFRHHKGRVYLSGDFQVSGYQSVAIQDVPGDCAFPELQGYFPLQKSGEVYAHFALLITDPSQTFNIALAGPEWFTERKDGIGFWLENRGGVLYHHVARRLERLLSLRPLAWYGVDLVYRIDPGTYDLTIREEGSAAPVVSVRGAKNAPGEKLSAVDKFSFVGDVFGDASSALYYVDDVIVGARREVQSTPLAAPGRKKLFVERWMEYQKEQENRLRCPDVLDPEDLGLPDLVLGSLRERELAALLGAPGALPPEVAEAISALGPLLDAGAATVLRAASEWKRGCALLEQEKYADAVASLARARQEAGGRGRLYDLSLALAQAAAGRWQASDEALLSAFADLASDIRLAVGVARIGIARDRVDKMERSLRDMDQWLPGELADAARAELWSQFPADGTLADLQALFPDTWYEHLQRFTLALQNYYILVWMKRYPEAGDFAARVAGSVERAGRPSGMWLGLVGDAYFFQGRYADALSRYEEALTRPRPPAVFLYRRLADVHYKLGDMESERRYRARLYGSLDRSREEEEMPLGYVTPPCPRPRATSEGESNLEEDEP